MKNKINLKKGDLLIYGVLLAVCCALLALVPRGQDPVAAVSIDGETVYRQVLSEIKQEQDIVLKNGVVITVAPNEIRFKASSCKGKDCIRTGRLTKAGQCAVCLPEKTVIALTGTDKSVPDGIVY